jgi:coronin-1B/1C/6
VLDIQCNPFNESLIASCSEDGTVKIWQIPEGGLTDTMREPLQNLIGHKRKVGQVKHHPTANNVLASTSTDYSVKVWDIESGDALFTLEGHKDIIQDCDWNLDGTQIVTSSKDKKTRVCDPRSGSIVSEFVAHEGVKGARAIWLGKTGKILTVGFSKLSDRQMAVWDPKSTSKALYTENIDTASGQLLPFYDDDTNVLYLSGKGDGNVRYFELSDDCSNVWYLSEYKSSTPMKGMCAAPKVALKINECEVMRLLKLGNHNVQPISFNVPRKSEMFQDDLFPDTYAYKPSMSAKDYSAGKTAKPLTVSLSAGFVPIEKPQELKVEKQKEDDGPQDENKLREDWKALKNRVSYLEAELAKRDAKIKELGGN